MSINFRRTSSLFTRGPSRQAVVSDHKRRPVILMAHPGADLYGADRVFLESVDCCVADGLDVVVTIPGPGALVQELESRGVRVIYCLTPVLRKSLLTITGILQLATKTIMGLASGWRLIRLTKPRVIYVNTLTIPLWILLARIFRLPVVSHVHEAEKSIPKFQRLLLSAPLLLSTRIIVNSCFTSNVLAADIPRLHKKISVVLNGVAGPLTKTAPRALIIGALNMLYVGRVSHRKGVDVAIEAVKCAQDRGVTVHLDIVGTTYPGNEEFEKDLRQLINQLNVRSSITMHGFQSDIWSYLDRTDIAIVPSRADESFGNTAVEAILAERPLIVSSKPGLIEAAGGYGAPQFVAPDDPAAITDAIVMLYENWGHYRGLVSQDSETAGVRQSTEQFRGGVRKVLCEFLR